MMLLQYAIDLPGLNNTRSGQFHFPMELEGWINPDKPVDNYRHLSSMIQIHLFEQITNIIK